MENTNATHSLIFTIHSGKEARALIELVANPIVNSRDWSLTGHFRNVLSSSNSNHAFFYGEPIPLKAVSFNGAQGVVKNGQVAEIFRKIMGNAQKFPDGAILENDVLKLKIRDSWDDTSLK